MDVTRHRLAFSRLDADLLHMLQARVGEGRVEDAFEDWSVIEWRNGGLHYDAQICPRTAHYLQTTLGPVGPMSPEARGAAPAAPAAPAATDSARDGAYGTRDGAHGAPDRAVQIADALFVPLAVVGVADLF